MTKPKRIPYGIADYRRMRQDDMYYVDKAAFIPLIELVYQEEVGT